MNNITLTRNTNSVFETKEEYVAFRAKWKQLHADGFHKPNRIEYQHGSTYEKTGELNQYGNPRYAHVPGGTGYHMVSALSAWHHLVFNLAIGRNPPSKAFPKVAEATTYSKPYLWYALGGYNTYAYGIKHDFELFGDSLTDEQKAKLTVLVDEFRRTL